jgi:Tetratricopeptide repeat
MNCTDINTAAEIIAAFRVCNNPGEQIELFECLATRSDPPVDTFVEILAGVKLEVVVVLTIQAFGKITDADTKVRLKESDGLLTILSQYAQSGATDLIRWMAATTINIVGFDFIQVSLHLTEEPRKITEKILQSKVRRFADSNLVNSDDYDEFVRFWIYGAKNELRDVTLKIKHESAFRTVLDVIKSNPLFWIKHQNAGFKVARAMERNPEGFMSALSGVRDIISIDYMIALNDNDLFEKATQILSGSWLQYLLSSSQADADLVNVLLDNQFDCLQSGNPNTRQQAAQTIAEIGGASPIFANAVKERVTTSNFILGKALVMFKLEFGTTNYDDETLEMMRDRLGILAQSLIRKKVRQDCQLWLEIVSQEIQQRKQRKEAKEREIQQAREREIQEREQKQQARERQSLYLEQAAQVKKNNSKEADRINVNKAWREFTNGVSPWNDGKFHESIPAFKRAIEIARKDEDAHDFAQEYSFLADAHFWIAITMREEGNLIAAITACQKSIQIEPTKNPGVYNILGLSLLEKGNPVDAISVFKKLVEIDPEYGPSYYNLGIALAENNQVAEAIAIFKKAREVYVAQGNTQKVKEINEILTETGFE